MERPAAFSAAKFFVLRTPLLPFDVFRAWGEGLESPAATDDMRLLEASLANDKHRLTSRLKEIVTRPEVREALFLASPDLDQSLDIWLQAPTSERGSRIERSLVRYLARMAGRSTPFGLLAGCSLGLVGEHTRLEIQGLPLYERHSRLDMGHLHELTDGLEAIPALKRALTFRPNSSLL